MNGLELFTHATNTHGSTGEDAKTAEEFLDEMRKDAGDDYGEQLERALMFVAGFDVLEVDEVFE